jgi:hypothetical protein
MRRPGWRVAVGAPAFLLCDVAVLWVSIHALGRSVPAAPLIPGGLGILDGGLAAALVAYHVPAATALGGVLIYHALALWIPTVSGTLAFIAAVRERVPPPPAPDTRHRVTATVSRSADGGRAAAGAGASRRCHIRTGYVVIGATLNGGGA